MLRVKVVAENICVLSSKSLSNADLLSRNRGLADGLIIGYNRSNRLEHQLLRTILSPKDLATAIGVSESSLKRWADEGRLKVSRTAGGHRRIPMEEAIRFIRTTGQPVVRPDVLGLSELADVPRPSTDTPAEGIDAERSAQLVAALKAGDLPLGRGLILSWYLQGVSLGELFDGPVRTAMTELGMLWKHADEGIFVEHRSTDICIQALNQLRGLIGPPPPTAPLAMGGAPSGDPYIIPSLMASMVLLEAGFRTTNIGPDIPLKVLADAAISARANLVWVSFTSISRRRDLIDHASELAGQLAQADAELVVGGQQIDASVRIDQPNVHVARSMGELAALARGLSRSAGEA